MKKPAVWLGFLHPLDRRPVWPVDYFSVTVNFGGSL